jgi:Mycothiol maleylpyruvate isomerase N-terminal domain
MTRCARSYRACPSYQRAHKTWCSGWSAHDLTAHVTAAAEERADLIDDHLAGKPSRATRSREVREPPFRAMPDAVLRERLQENAVRFERNVSALREDDTIVCPSRLRDPRANAEAMEDVLQRLCRRGGASGTSDACGFQFAVRDSESLWVSDE